MKLTNEQIQAILDGAPEGSEQVLIVEDSAYYIRSNGESILEYLKSHKTWVKCEGFEDVDNIHSLSGLREILTLRQEVERLKAQIPKWISVEDELPSKCKHNDLSISVLVYNEQSKCKYTAIYDYKQKDWLCFNSGQILYFGITHWMPLPSQPQEKDHE